jgi:hypothetical protein
VIYGFETGALLVDGATAAPARRVHFFLRDDTFVNLTPDGLALFEAALEWAVNRDLTFEPPVEPQIGTINVMAGNLQFSGTGGLASGTYHVLCTTNLALPLSSWTPVLTNTFDTGGNFNVSLPVGADPNQYYIILVP